MKIIFLSPCLREIADRVKGRRNSSCSNKGVGQLIFGFSDLSCFIKTIMASLLELPLSCKLLVEYVSTPAHFIFKTQLLLREPLKGIN